MIGYWFFFYIAICGEFIVRVNGAETTRDEHVDFSKEYNDPCFDNPCKNEGVCIVNNTDYICECKQPYNGNQCEIHPCHANPCFNDGACIAVENTYGCVCDEPFYGRHCENDPCSTNPCKNEGLCSVVGIDFNCTCKAPYFGKQCEIEFDVTATTDYFTSDLTTNTDECYCGENSERCSLDGRRKKVCVCKDGFAQRWGTETCTRTCQSNAECRNDGICDRDGPGYFCLCPEPYTGDRCETDACKSIQFKCYSMGAKCVRNGNTGVCECPIGKKLSPFNYCEDICTPETCVNGRCEITSSNYYICKCYDGYYGTHCEISSITIQGSLMVILVILAAGIVFFSIASIIAGCWVKKLKKRIEDNAKNAQQP